MFFSLTTFGHNPLSAHYRLINDGRVSMLTINLSQSGINNLLFKSFGEEEANKLSRQGLSELIVWYVKQNSKIYVDEKLISLGEGGVKIGSHQTDLKFVLSPLSIDARNIRVVITAFRDNGRHQTIFSYAFPNVTGKVILSQKNNYSAIIDLRNNGKEK